MWNGWDLCGVWLRVRAWFGFRAGRIGAHGLGGAGLGRRGDLRQRRHRQPGRAEAGRVPGRQGPGHRDRADLQQPDHAGRRQQRQVAAEHGPAGLWADRHAQHGGQHGQQGLGRRDRDRLCLGCRAERLCRQGRRRGLRPDRPERERVGLDRRRHADGRALRDHRHRADQERHRPERLVADLRLRRLGPADHGDERGRLMGALRLCRFDPEHQPGRHRLYRPCDQHGQDPDPDAVRL